MKKALVAILAIVIGIAFVSGVSAQSATDKATKTATDAAQEKGKAAVDATKEKAAKAATDKTAPPTEKAAPAPEKKAEKKPAAKEKVHQFTGDVTAVDMAAKTLTAKNKKGEKTFDLSSAAMKGEPKVGDKIMVKYVERDGKMVAKSIAAQGAKKAAKKTGKADAPAAGK